MPAIENKQTNQKGALASSSGLSCGGKRSGCCCASSGLSHWQKGEEWNHWWLPCAFLPRHRMEQQHPRHSLAKSLPRKSQTYSLRGRPLVGRGLKDCPCPAAAAASPSPTAATAAPSGRFPGSSRRLPREHLHCASACAGWCGTAHAATLYSSSALRCSKRDDLRGSPKRTCGGNHAFPDGGQRLWHGEPRSGCPSTPVPQPRQTADVPSVRGRQRYSQPFLQSACAAQRLCSFQWRWWWQMGCRGQAPPASRSRSAGRPVWSTVGSTGEQGKAAHKSLPDQPLLKWFTEDIWDWTLSGPVGGWITCTLG